MKEINSNGDYCVTSYDLLEGTKKFNLMLRSKHAQSRCHECVVIAQGMEAIAELSRLTSLKLMRAKELPPIEFIATFSSSKLERLTSLNLSECCLLDDACLTAVANTCRFLQVKSHLLNFFFSDEKSLLRI